MPKFRPFDPALHTRPIELLYDADEYFPDLLESMKGLTAPKLFIAGWYISTGIELRKGHRLEDLIVEALKQPESSCHILWNSNVTGPAPRLYGQVEAFWKRVAARIGGETVAAQRLKIIIAVNLEYDPGYFLRTASGAGRLIPLGRPDTIIPPSLMDRMQRFWERQFTSPPPGGYRNLTQFTMGSHHQKTFIVAGKRNGGQTLTGYCGMDLAGSVAGGGTMWHDGCLRVRSDMALGLVDNFVERWNFEVDQLAKVVSFGVSTSDTLDADDVFVKENHPQAAAITTRRTLPYRVEVQGATWIPIHMAARHWQAEIKTSYLDLLGDAEQWLYIENQYFRHPGFAEALVEQLSDEAQLRVTIVLPSYSEEIGTRSDLPALRDTYAATTDPAKRTAMLDQARRLGLSIDPFNKVTLLMQNRCLAELVKHPRVRIWMPRRRGKRSARPYIHTKLMLVDDEALFIGSANINGRSLDGYADSEINLLLTDVAEIARIKGRIKWQNEPEDESAANYRRWSVADPRPTYYARYNLVRYTVAHWEMDRAFSTFPMGRAAILDYWDAFTKKTSKRVDTWTPDTSRAELETYLDGLDEMPGFDLETFDWGDFFVEHTTHLL
ncbi:hypothetical protein GCM10022251_30500 [Phytohabitans flavus]|uniref:PLD phosphodiesterase domain-containing protein n=1 Tax=Phytohabitans flavus TaxID=1076124 RepID=A0A6F8XX01_9ACTN|nr:phospholipase D-like domain-containing protein [Phytohabitans flavus]BCB78366.1 hypothetical protein Pflav_047760 [Phytohabitans flavus]